MGPAGEGGGWYVAPRVAATVTQNVPETSDGEGRVPFSSLQSARNRKGAA